VYIAVVLNRYSNGKQFVSGKLTMLGM